MAGFDGVAASVVSGDATAVRQRVEQCLADGTAARDILDRALIPAMTVVGQKMADGEYFLPEVLIAARAMYSGLKLIKPHIAQEDVPPRGVVVLGTVKGDVHDIGKNLVGMMLEGAGFEVIDLGTNVAPAAFAGAVRERRPQLIGMSAMLTTTMAEMRNTVSALKAASLRESVKIVIGGAPTSARWAAEIGADGWGANAAQAVELAKRLVPLA